MAKQEYFMNFGLYHDLFYVVLQESPLPDPSELFSNVYVKGLGVEVQLFLSHSLIFREILITIENKVFLTPISSADNCPLSLN